MKQDSRFIGHAAPVRKQHIPFWIELTSDGKDFSWIAGYLEAEKIRDDYLPALVEALKRARETPPDIELFERWIDDQWEEYAARRKDAVKRILQRQRTRLGKDPATLFNLLIYSAEDSKLPAMVTRDELREAVKELARENPGMSADARAKEIKSLRDEIDEYEGQLAALAEPFMAESGSGMLVDMRAVFVNHWRSVQYAVGADVGPQGFDLKNSGKPVQKAHRALGLTKTERSGKYKPAVFQPGVDIV